MRKFIIILIVISCLIGSCAAASYEATLSSLQKSMASAHSLAESARFIGYWEDYFIIRMAKDQWHTAHNEYVKLTRYPAAARIWLYLKDQGFNDAVCAGILGNIMAEVGGQTLDIRYWIGGNGYYGMCQWSKAYCPDVWGLGLYGQLDYLMQTIHYEFDTFGFCYKKGFTYEDFIQMTDEKEAALAFAKCYERCASQHYYIRTINATKALEYFT